MTMAQDKKDDAKVAKKVKDDADAVGMLTVGDDVTVGGKRGLIVEALKSADSKVRHYRVELAPDKKGDQPEIKTFAASEVKLFVPPEDAGSETETFEAGDQVIARGGERGAVVEAVSSDAEPRLRMYSVQFGGRLGLAKIRGEELQKVETPKVAK